MANIVRPRIYSHFTNKVFLNVEDALDLSNPKVRLFAGIFQSGGGMQSYRDHFLDVDDARVLFTDLAYGREVNWTEHKGSERGGQLTSYRLKVNTKKRDGADTSVFIELSAGPGVRTGAGIIEPVNGRYTQNVNVHLQGWQARRLGHAVMAYLAAYDVARLLQSGRQFPPIPTSADHASVGWAEE